MVTPRLPDPNSIANPPSGNVTIPKSAVERARDIVEAAARCAEERGASSSADNIRRVRDELDKHIGPGSYPTAVSDWQHEIRGAQPS